MTKSDFLDLLREKISRLPEWEAAKTVVYYSEMIDDRIEDGMSEEDADYGSNSLSRTDGEGQRRAKIYAYYGDINLSFEEDRKNSPLTDGDDSPPYAYTGEPDGEPSPHGETEKTEPEDGTPGDEIIPEDDGVPQGEERMQSSGGFALPLVPAVMSPCVRTFCMLAD